MILICDLTASERAFELRRQIHRLGCPAAVSDISSIRQHLPAMLIITFSDAFDALRHMPYDDITAIVLGDGFVNTALNARRAASTDEAVSIAREFILASKAIPDSARFPFGVMVNGIFIGKYFIEYHGVTLELTSTEYLMFKYLLAFGVGGSFVGADSLCSYCCPSASDKSNVVSSHISRLNSRLESVFGKRMITSVRNKGYSIKIR